MMKIILPILAAKSQTLILTRTDDIRRRSQLYAKNANIILFIWMALIGSSSNLFAQCGSSVNGSVVYCCGVPTYINAEWMPGGEQHLGQETLSCNYIVSGCNISMVFAGGSCVNASLSTPEMRRQLDQISQHMPLLVASCTGGLVPYQPHAEVPDDKKFILRSPKLDLTGGGE